MQRLMKRIGNIYHQIYAIENIRLADQRARKGKRLQKGIIEHDKNKEADLLALQEMFKNKTYKTSTYKTFTIYEPKERIIYKLPYFPDRIAQHAVMNVLESIFVSMFTSDTYSCIKGKGVHGAVYALKGALRDVNGTIYCLKLDIKKFYPSIDHTILKQQLRRKFKDNDLLWLLDEIIDSTTGLPIGNYLSQYFANFFLTPFDHWIKEVKRIENYFRYADDLVFLSPDKPSLHQLLADIREYMHTNLNLEIKGNYQVFPVSARGIDFVGYKQYHTHILIRKSIKKNFARMVKGNKKPQSVAAYKGWTSHGDCKHLVKKLLNGKFKTV